MAMGDIPSGPSSLQETLEAEFCPPLDTTLVAAFLADHISPNESPTEAVLKKLREELSTLAASAAADQDDLAVDFDDDLHLSTNASSATTTTATTTEDNYDADSAFSQSGPEASLSSRSSNSPPSDVTYPTDSYPALAFLRAAFPHLSARELEARINEADVDMVAVVEDLLSQDCVRELEERGLEGEEQEEESENWTLINRKTKPPSRLQTSPGKRRKPKGKTLAINDIRQKQHFRPDSHIRTSGDPWVQVSSISSRLEELLPSSSTVFQSYLHNPEFGTPSMAVRAALNSITPERKEKSPGNRQDTTSSLFTLIQFIRVSPEYDFGNANSEARAQICSDAELALAAAEGSPDVALDIVKLLYDLDMDNESNQEMGVYHSPVPSRPSSQISTTIKPGPGTSSTPSSPLSPTRRSTIPVVPPFTVPKERPPPAPSQSSWQLVKPSRPKPPDVHPLAAHIPAYNLNNVPRRKGRPIHPSVANPASSRKDNARSVIAARNGQPSLSRAVLGSGYKARIDACQARRYDALRAAGRHWASGGVRGSGGEVALFYAQEAQRHQAEAQRLQLDAMRELVDEKRYASTNTDVIDVHYCTTSEALVIVREVLDEGWVSSVRPLRVIIGRGIHSTGGVPVLGPAVKKALEQDGWSVGKLDIGLTVRGRVR